MSDLAPYQEAPSALMRFAQEASEVHLIAKGLASTSFVPKSMQGRPDEITGAILAGREIGLEPMTALASIDIIEGRPSIRANTQRGIAMAAGVQFHIVSSSDSRVVMRAKGPGQDAWTEVDWPIERARKMGLADKSNWKKMPQAMLIARATSELCRLVAANILIGMPYSTEELTDEVVIASVPDTDAKPAPAKRTAKRAVDPATVEPPLDEPPTPWPDEPVKEIEGPADPDAKLSEDSFKAIMAGFREIGVTDRPERLTAMSTVVGREVVSVTTLTEVEARRLIRWLQERRTGGGDWPEVKEVGA